MELVATNRDDSDCLISTTFTRWDCAQLVFKPYLDPMNPESPIPLN